MAPEAKPHLNILDDDPHLDRNQREQHRKVTMPCEHKASRSCSLTSTLGCCECADMRPPADSYDICVDGTGISSTPDRWAHYCPGCRSHFANPPLCHHKAKWGCTLTATKRCCACEDERSDVDTYQTYVDGTGFVMKGSRCAKYCTPCHNQCQARDLGIRAERAKEAAAEASADKTAQGELARKNEAARSRRIKAQKAAKAKSTAMSAEAAFAKLTAATSTSDSINEQSSRTSTAICAHKLVRHCKLTAIPDCCECADKRPEEKSYETYEDGRGLVKQSKRYLDYCPGCRDYFEPFKPLPVLRRSTAICAHKLDRHCKLTTIPVCCECADKRPEEKSYETYEDGRGVVKQSKRYLDYCPGCREYFEPFKPLPASTQQYASPVSRLRRNLRSTPSSSSQPSLGKRLLQRFFTNKRNDRDTTTPASTPSSSKDPLPDTRQSRPAPKRLEAEQHRQTPARDDDAPPPYSQYPRLPSSAYRVAWIVRDSSEAAVAYAALDEIHEPPEMSPTSTAHLHAGAIDGENVLIAWPTGLVFDLNAFLKNSMPSLQLLLVVSTGTGFPSASHDIRRGDVVVPHGMLSTESTSRSKHVVSDTAEGYIDDAHVRTALYAFAGKRSLAFEDVYNKLTHRLRVVRGSKWVSKAVLEAKAEHEDVLDEAGDVLVPRPRETSRPEVHYGTIGTSCSPPTSTSCGFLAMDALSYGLLDGKTTVVSIVGIAHTGEQRDHGEWVEHAMLSAVSWAVCLMPALMR